MSFQSSKENKVKNFELWMDMISYLTHDMSGPITFLDQYIRREFSPLHHEGNKVVDVDLLQIAINSFSKIKNMMDDLRNIAALAEFKPSYADIVEIAKNVIVELTPLANDVNSCIYYTGPDSIYASFDVKKVERSLYNLVKNAIEAVKAHEKGKIFVNIKNDVQNIFIEVKDNGVGIQKVKELKNFRKGFTYGKKNGSGLGLAYCNWVVNMHGGSISAYSDGKSGALFSIMLPDIAFMKITKGKDGCANDYFPLCNMDESDDIDRQVVDKIMPYAFKFSNVSECDFTLEPIS